MKLVTVSFLLIMSIFSSSTITLSQELSAIAPTCCCKTDCECSHEKSKETIIRNVKCGDNIPAIVSPFSSKQLISNIQIKFNQSKKVASETNLIDFKPKHTKFNIDPPPPQQLT